jgi:hypothetical protein
VATDSRAVGSTLGLLSSPDIDAMDLSIVHLSEMIKREPDDEAEAMIQQWPVRGGTGFFFTYFPLEIDMEHAIRISQTLAFIGTMTREPRVPSPLQVSRVLDVFCTGQYADLFGTEEQVGLFLIWRVSNRTNMRFFCTWYRSQVVRQVNAQIKSKLLKEILIAQRIALGCACLRCEIWWLLRGWSCPLKFV